MNPLTEIYVFENESFTLQCNYAGFPAPYITWIFNNSVVTNDSNSGVSIVNIKSETSGTSRLTISNVSSDESLGRYLCAVSNIIGTANTTFIVTLASKFRLENVIFQEKSCNACNY